MVSLVGLDIMIVACIRVTCIVAQACRNEKVVEVSVQCP